MATRISNDSGDWYAAIWYDSDANAIGFGPPASGDQAFLVAQAVTINAGDVGVHGTLNGIDLSFAWNHLAMPVLDVTNQGFGAAMSIGNNVDGGGGLLIARGNSASAGRILAQNAAAGGALTLDIESYAGMQRFTNSGLLGAVGGALVVTGGTLVNAGSLVAGTLDGGAIAGRVTLASALANTGAITVQRASSLAATGPVANSGTITNLSGTVAISGALANSGTIFDTAGSMTLSGPVTGSGSIHIGSAGTLTLGAVAAGQVLRFDAGLGILRLTDPGDFHATVQGLAGRDVIDLVGIAADATSYDSATGLLTVTASGTVVAQITLAAGSALTPVSDNAGGTILTAKLAGTTAQLTQALVDGAAGGQAHRWTTQAGSGAVVTYSFDPAAHWSAAEQAAFVKGLAIWAGIANIGFQAVDGGGQIQFVRGQSGGAATATQADGAGLLQSAVVSIDTGVPSFADIGASGVADIAAGGNFGGYAAMTLLHEIGHAIGLSHPGSYDITADLATQQVYYLDSQQYTLMSYFDAAATGADWTAAGYAGTARHPQTPMLDDIAAIQQIYGANTTTLAGSQVFGFHSSFAAGSAWDAYNFALNPVPVVTLWGGTADTLDLSGFAGASLVDLRQGGFSSVAGLTDNIAIAFGTSIDTAIGGAGDDRFVLNGDGDRIDGGGGANSAVFAGTRAQYALSAAGGVISAARGGQVDRLTNVQTLVFADQSVAADSIGPVVACFVRGTRILTRRGELPVEQLRAGTDLAITAAGRARRIAWVGWRRVALRGHRRPWDVDPVRVRAGAIAPGAPARDLFLSPDHALLLDGVLVPVRHLLNGATITQEAHWRMVDYFHVELASHDILLAEGLAAESYLDTGNRAVFSGDAAPARVETSQHHARAVWRRRGCAPLVPGGPALAAIRARLIARAEAIGWARTACPDLRLLADGRAIRPEGAGPVARFRLPPRTGAVRLVSRRAAPAEVRPDSEDRRVLGVAVSEITADGAALALGGPGWHGPEPGWRWTDGDAVLDAGGAARLEVAIALPHRYWLGGAQA